MATALLVAIILYLGLMLGIALWSRNKINSESDFLVAGRRLPTALASATLLATWFGAGTLLTATDEIRNEGLTTTALEPYGAGMCLILAGFFVAKPLWEMNILTIADFFRVKFGKTAEQLSVWLTVPGYLGWIAVQIVALAGILNVFLGLSMATGMIAVTVVATVYTCLGGMWSVTVTDSIQMSLVVIGVVLLGYTVFDKVTDQGWWSGFQYIIANTKSDHLVWIPREKFSDLLGWLNVFAIAALGNISGPDLAQRIFSAKSAKVAQDACLIAGLLYVILGSIPVALGIAANVILPTSLEQSILPALAQQFLSPALTVVFVLALLSVVLSTIDSAILATSSLIANNLINRYLPADYSTVKSCQYCTIGVAAGSLLVAFIGESAYALLEEAYAIGLVGLFVPFALGIYLKNLKESSALVAMILGIGVWLLPFTLEFDFAIELLAVAVAFIGYFAHAYLFSAPFPGHLQGNQQEASR